MYGCVFVVIDCYVLPVVIISVLVWYWFVLVSICVDWLCGCLLVVVGFMRWYPFCIGVYPFHVCVLYVCLLVPYWCLLVVLAPTCCLVLYGGVGCCVLCVAMCVVLVCMRFHGGACFICVY